MDGTFDHEDPNNRPEEIPMNDLNNYNEDNDEYFDALDLDTMETIFTCTGTGSEMIGDNDQNILVKILV